MQQTSQTWQDLVATGSYILQTSAEINGVSYVATTAPLVSRGLTDNSLTVGGCSAATLSLSLVTTDDIPKAAEIRLKMRLLPIGASDDSGATEWLPVGTFYVSKRERDWITNLVTIQAYDAMLRKNQTFNSVSAWPKSLLQAAGEAAALMEVALDSRTDLPDIYIPDPTGSTISELLEDIAGISGGNWIITPENKLRLVPLITQPTAANAEVIEAILQKLTIGDTATITGVTGTDTNGLEYTAGTDTGYVLNIGTNAYATQANINALYAGLNGLVHVPFTATGALYDPALELGDPVSYGDGLVTSILMNESVSYGVAFRSTASAPVRNETDNEYPYESATARSIAALRAKQDATIVFDVLSTEDALAGTTTLTARVTQGGEDITRQFDPSMFTWQRKTEAGVVDIGDGYTKTVNNTDFVYGGVVICRLSDEDLYFYVENGMLYLNRSQNAQDSFTLEDGDLYGEVQSGRTYGLENGQVYFEEDDA